MLDIGLHIVECGLLRFAWQQLDSCIVNLGAGCMQVGLVRCPDGAQALCRGCVSGGLRSQNGTFSLYQ